jgi:hypothetical protein
VTHSFTTNTHKWMCGVSKGWNHHWIEVRIYIKNFNVQFLNWQKITIPTWASLCVTQDGWDWCPNQTHINCFRIACLYNFSLVATKGIGNVYATSILKHEKSKTTLKKKENLNISCWTMSHSIIVLFYILLKINIIVCY